MKWNVLERIRQRAAEASELLMQGKPLVKIECGLSLLLFHGDLPVSVCNENMAFYLSDEEFFYFYFLHSAQGGLLQELEEHIQPAETLALADSSLRIYPMCGWLRRRMHLPKVLLVNLHYTEKYPSYRFALGIADIAGYLRKQGLARVTIADMQFTPKHEIKKLFFTEKYDLIGLSTNFGHFSLMEELISEVFAKSAGSRVIVGNYLAATEFQHILELYPKVLVSSSEGELTFASLCKNFIEGNHQLNNVPNLYYSVGGEICFTFQQLIEMDALALPAFDTVEALFKHGGVMTLEFSRGCNYGKCSFCPRGFKGLRWRGMSPPHMLRMWERYYQLFQLYSKAPYLYFADEEFLGNCKDNANFKRIDTFLHEALSKALPMDFDISCRLDQIVDKARDLTWSCRQMTLLEQARQLGLKRIFTGLESGSDAQLHRYNKGLDFEQAVCALRLLSHMGFTLRLGFITFDPLMTKEDLAQNLRTFMRRDILLVPGHVTDTELEAILQTKTFATTESPFLFEAISYPASPLEVLRGCDYAKNVLQEHPELVGCLEFTDHFGRLECGYLDPDIQQICALCQKWVNFHFPFVYVVKGLAKRGDANLSCYHEMIQMYRYYTCILLVCLCYNKGIIPAADFNQYLDALSLKSRLMESVCLSGTKKIILAVETALKENMQHCIDMLMHRGGAQPQELMDIYYHWRVDTVLSADSVRKT